MTRRKFFFVFGAGIAGAVALAKVGHITSEVIWPIGVPRIEWLEFISDGGQWHRTNTPVRVETSQETLLRTSSRQWHLPAGKAGQIIRIAGKDLVIR